MLIAASVDSNRWHRPSAAAVLLLLVWTSLCGAKEVSPAPRGDFRFETAGVLFSTAFPAGRIADCTAMDENQYRITIRPENTPINNSPWYAFQVLSTVPRTISVRLVYEGGTHRYRPKISRDGRNWTLLGKDACRVERTGREAVLQLEVGPRRLWVAAQELITASTLEGWMDRLCELPFVKKRVIGQSLQGRPLHALQIGNRQSKRIVFILGRQHPPEVTGSLGLMHFVETIAGDSDLADCFRRQFLIVVAPLANPDAVEAGHWRHSMGGVDLNRDWEAFQQPETRAIRDEILRLSREQGRLHLFLDFHSTHQDIFYIQPDDAVTFPADFTPAWLDAIASRFPDYRVRREATSHTGKPTSMRWVYRTFGAVAITYEWGDRTGRDRIAEIAPGAAEEMMRLLLATMEDAVENAAAAESR